MTRIGSIYVIPETHYNEDKTFGKVRSFKWDDNKPKPLGLHPIGFKPD